FWGEGIYSVTALLGNNGAGKSTVMSAIMEATVEGNGDKEDVDAILVYEDDGTLFYYCRNARKHTLKLENVSVRHIYESRPISIYTFYYTGHFSPHVNADIRWSKLGGLYNASDISLLVNDYLTYLHIDGLRMEKPLYEYLTTHVAENNYRICQLLNNKLARVDLKDFKFPKYLILTPNMRGANRLKKEKHDIPTIEEVFNGDMASKFKDSTLFPFVYYGLLNCICDEQVGGLTGKELLYHFVEMIKNAEDNSSLIDLLDKLVKFSKDSGYKQNLAALRKLVSHISKTAERNDEINIYYYTFNEVNDYISDLFRQPLSGTLSLSRFFDFSYSKSLENNNFTLLSSGELAILNLFSRLFAAVKQKANREEIGIRNNNILILLDETELGLHPAWQRQYISLLCRFLNCLVFHSPLMRNRGYTFQVVMASHSPILLSDIPRACSNYLGANKEKIEETFASNIFELYRNSFFMKDGLMGAFAEKKVNSLLERIQNDQNVNESEIEMIGDERIRLYLQHEVEKRIDQRPREEQIAYYQKKLQELQNQNT
ncbi:MAG: AAA family ATPase, partial [Paludibacteraceae bacterium]